MFVDRVDADLLDHGERRRRGHPHEPGGRRVESPCACSETQWAAEKGRHRILAREPAGRLWDDRAQALWRDRHERRPTGRHQPLVCMRGDHVEAARVERQPADCLSGVDDRHRAVLGGRSCDRVEIRDLSRRHLHGTERDNVDVRPDLSSQFACGNETGCHSAMFLHEEREELGGELDLGREDARAVGDRGGNEPDERRHVRPDGDALDRHADEPREGRTCVLAGDSPVLPARPPAVPVVEGALERVPRWSRRQAVRRGVEIRGRWAPHLLRLGDLHRRQSDAPELDSLSWRKRPSRRLSGAQRRRRR